MAFPPTDPRMPTLHDLIKAGSRYAEYVFSCRGEFTGTCHAVTSDQKSLIVSMPPVDDLDLALKILREFFLAKDVVAYVFVNEGFIVRGSFASVEEAMTVEPSEHLDRREVIILSAESEIEGTLMGQREIFRPRGRKPYLGPLEILPYKEFGGRALGLLARRTTLQ